MACPFCERASAADGLIVANDLAVVFLDKYPLTHGHCLIVPRRHEPDFLALTVAEQAAIWALVPAARRSIEETNTPDGYNVGINIGDAAGQTVAHAHLHLIPRYRGDVPDPRGGIRWVVPRNAAYWNQI